MNAVILAGGKGTRLFPLTARTPKPMVSFFGRPVLEHQIEMLKRQGFTDIIITVGHLKEAMINYFGDGVAFGVRIRYVVEESPLGTAGGVKLAEELLDDTFVILSGDAVTDVSLRAAVQFHNATEAAVTLLVTEVDDPSQYGIAQMDERGRINRFFEKPKAHEVFSRTANTGMYVMSKRCLQSVPAGTPFDFSKDLFPHLLAGGEKLCGYRIDGQYWNDIGSLGEYLAAHRDALDGRVNLPLVRLRAGQSRQATVHPRAAVDPFAIVKRGAFIDDGALVDEGTFVGANARVGASALVRRSVINHDCVIGEACVLEEVVLAPGTRVPPHTVICSEAAADFARLGLKSRSEPGVVALA